MIKVDYEHCTGCGACVQICPVRCIDFTEDRNGFKYPKVNEDKCINCGKCNRTCPIGSKSDRKQGSHVVYAAQVKSEEKLLNCTSGGAFGVMAEKILSKGGIVYGCAFDDQLQAKHIRIETLIDLEDLKGSKYVQSNIGTTYENARDDLEKGYSVLYSGTPCQIAGLLHYLGKRYENLITIDIICHGVPSQKFFDNYIKYLEQKESGKISKYDFRSKRTKGWSLAGSYSVERNSLSTAKKLFYFDHYYYFYFLQGYTYRESCYSCEYANMDRTGDISLGDLWGGEALNLGFDATKGLSLVISNSEKGNGIIDLCRSEINIKTISEEHAKRYNQQLKEASKSPENRKWFMDNFALSEGKQIQKYMLSQNLFVLLVARLKYLLPQSLKNKLIKLKYR